MAAGSDAARNVAEIVLIDNDFASMPAVVAEGRRSINNLQRSASLFLTKTLFSMGLAALCIFFPPYPFQPITMTLINFFCIGFPSFVLALESNKSRIKGSFLANVLRRAIPASVAVLVAACLDMFVASVFGFDKLTLSTMCLISTSAIGCSLIWRISFPFSPLRLAVFIFVTAGLIVGVVFFPAFFSIAQLTLAQLIGSVVIAALGCLLFFMLADLFGKVPQRVTKRATGFGRGVRMSLRGGKRTVSSTGSSFERKAGAIAQKVSRVHDKRELSRAQASARRAVDDSTPATRVLKRVTKAGGGIRVAMPSSAKRKSDTKR